MTKTGVKATAQGLDWLTATAKQDKIGYVWYEIFRRHSHAEKKGNLGIVEWRNRWYVGQACAGLRYGYSEQLGYIMIASGARANEYWRKLLTTSKNISRLDVQVTILLEPALPDLASRAWENRPGGGMRKYAYIQNSRDGRTVYVGSRNSDQYGRLYDKGVKDGSNPAGHLWRYEVELKNVRANLMAEKLIDGDRPPRETEHLIRAYVHNWFSTRRITPYFRAGYHYPELEVGRRVSTATKKLTWLRTQVAPSVEQLIAYGHGREVMQALGLTGRQLEMLGLYLDPVSNAIYNLGAGINPKKGGDQR